MYRTRALLSKAGTSLFDPYVLLYHHRNPSLLPPRIPGSLTYTFHNIISAASAVFRITTSQSCRDQFVFLTGDAPSSDAEESKNDNGNKVNDSIIINTSVLKQSDMGILKALSLYQDLSSPLYDQSGFNIQEFMHGCGWALRHFHRNKNILLAKVIRDKGPTSNLGSNLGASDVAGTLEAAAAEPGSLENSFFSMTTPEIIQHFWKEGTTKLMLSYEIGRNDGSVPSLAIKGVQSDKGRLGKNVDTHVKNVALISARVEEIYPPPHEDVQKIDNDPDAPLVDVYLTPHRNLRDKDPTAQVVTQLEVLYELQQSSIDSDKNTHTQTSMMVAKFEGCLDGDPNVVNDLQWRLCSYRPAAEFGYFSW